MAVIHREGLGLHALLVALLAPSLTACGPEAGEGESFGVSAQALEVEPRAAGAPIALALVTPTPPPPTCLNPLVINVNSFIDDTSDCTPAVLPSVMPSCTPSASTSLREAILMANSNTDRATDCTRILLPAGTYTLTLDSGDPSYALVDPFGDDLDVWASKPLIIVGADAATTIVQANASFPGVQGPPPREHRVLQMYLGSQPTYVDSVTFEGGYDQQGGGIYLGGFGFEGVPRLTLVNSVVQNNRALQGAGIYTSQDTDGLELYNTIVRDNRADSYLPNDFNEGTYTDRVGAAIYHASQGPLHIADSQITGNTAAAVADGGTAYGGGLWNSYFGGPTLIEYTTFDNNAARGGPQGNAREPGDAYGGGIYAQPGSTFYVVSTTISNNTAIGGVDNPAAPGANNGNGFGGGVYVSNGGSTNGVISLTNFINVTLASNQAVASATNGSAAGGGLYGGWGFSAFYLTVAGNRATWGNTFQTPSSAGGGVYLPGADGSEYFFWRSALGGNLANAQASDCEGSPSGNEGGVNVVGAGSCFFDEAANLSKDPGFGTLRDHGGAVKTVAPRCAFPPFSHANLVDPALLPNSTPAVDSKVITGLPLVDARGELRAAVQGTFIDGDLFDAIPAGIDSGAFEAQPPTLDPGASSPVAIAGGAFVPLTPAGTFSDPDLPVEASPLLGAAFYVSVVSGGEAGDELGVATGDGIAVNGSNITINGEPLATLQVDGAVPVANLFVELTGATQSTAANARLLLQKLAYRHTGSAPQSLTRSVSLALCDGGGGISLGTNVQVALCAPSAVTDTTCDNVDDDCSGAADEDYVALTTDCGIGACAATGTTSCGGGEISNSCVEGSPLSPDDASCDGVDDNCSGEADEDYVPVPTNCGVGVCAASGSSSCSGGEITDGCTPGSPLSVSDTTCDGVDDDCSGAADEDYVSLATNCGIGACAATGSTTCGGGEVSDSCSVGSPVAATDTTCDGVDDDCSGAADEDYVSQPTSCGIGVCAATGSTSCVGGQISSNCTPGAAQAATDTTCDGIDQDCSGAADEDYVSLATHCGIGACAATGSTTCGGGEVSDSCSVGSPAAATDATCDGVDDDCSGAADEDYVAQPTSCGIGVCAATGSTSCVGGQISSNCTPGAAQAATDTTCDGVDDDCSGAADEDYVSLATNCGIGACAATGSTSCGGGAVSDSCSAGSPLAATDTTCDGIDQDCSGAADEDYVSLATNCGIGACAATGSTTCGGGEVSDSCSAGSPVAITDTTCDGVDDDCSGAADEDYVAQPTSCGIGVCAATGSTSCVAGQISSNCTPGAAQAATDTTCDGIDQDCSGAADEDYVSLATNCGIGACAATGSTSCGGGEVSDSCSAGSPVAATDTTCDGVDDDCSGAADEDYVAQPTSCGIGVCAATGSTSCVGGQISSNCTPGTPLAATDTTCNGVDDDCSGSADEDYVPVTTHCGVGACAATGTTSCGGGEVSDSCRSGSLATATDTTCDGVDDDCSGSADEDYVPLTTSCGIGACSASGSTSCTGGQVTDGCTPGAPVSVSDTSCDAIDDDCDGSSDEDYVPLQTTCGEGACAATGISSCEAGSVADSCVTDAGDDDGDGLLDCEDACPTESADTADGCPITGAGGAGGVGGGDPAGAGGATEPETPEGGAGGESAAPEAGAGGETSPAAGAGGEGGEADGRRAVRRNDAGCSCRTVSPRSDARWLVTLGALALGLRVRRRRPGRA